MRSLFQVPAGVLLFVSGCAANETMAQPGTNDPDCSFRSPTTCWTTTGRFPPRQQTGAKPPNQRAPENPPVLATTVDSVPRVAP